MLRIGLLTLIIIANVSSCNNAGMGIDVIPTVGSDEYSDNVEELDSICHSQILSPQDMPDSWVDSCCLDILAGYFEKKRNVGYQIEPKDTTIVKTVFWSWWKKSHAHLNEIDRLLFFNHFLSQPNIYTAEYFEDDGMPPYSYLAEINCYQAFMLSKFHPELSFLQEEFLQRIESMKVPGAKFDISELEWNVSRPQEIFDSVSDPWRISILANGDMQSLDSLHNIYAENNQEWMMAIWYEWVADRFNKPEMYKAAADALSRAALSSSQAKRAQEQFTSRYNQANISARL